MKTGEFIRWITDLKYLPSNFKVMSSKPGVAHMYSLGFPVKRNKKPENITIIKKAKYT